MKRGISSYLRRILLTSVSIFLAFQSQTLAQERATRIDNLIQGLHDSGRFDGAVLAAMNGRVVFQKGYGLANREWDIPNTPDTKYRIASITKQITAMIIMILQEKGHVEVHDPVCDYVIDCPEAWNDITIHHLLTHTSGIPNFQYFPDNWKYERLPTTVEETVERFRHSELMFPPGSDFGYSSSGYVLLGYIIEQASGTPYDRAVEHYIFDPLQMEDSGYDHPRTVLPWRASGYQREGQMTVNAEYFEMDTPHAAGALYSTVADLYLWDRALYTTRLVSQETLDAIFAEHEDLGDGIAYGYGWYISQMSDRRTFWHGGYIEGFRALLFRFPDDGVLVASLSNHEDDLYAVNEGITAILFNE